MGQGKSASKLEKKRGFRTILPSGSHFQICFHYPGKLFLGSILIPKNGHNVDTKLEKNTLIAV